MSWANMDDINSGVINLLRVNMDLKPREKLLVMTDIPRSIDWESQTLLKLEDMLERNVLARLVVDVAKKNFPENEVQFLPFLAVGGNGVELNDDVATRMLEADVLLAITTYSLSHTNARSSATTAGVRVASMPGFEAYMLKADGPVAADANKIAADCNAFALHLSPANNVRLVTEYGTDLTFSIQGRPGKVDDGLLTAGSGKWGNLPSGEAYAIPVEGSGNGKLVVPVGWYEHLLEEMTFKIEKGEVTRIQGGGLVGDWLRKMLNVESEEMQYKVRRNLAELGIGANPNAQNPENALEAEKIKGTVHIAFGDNLHMGGQVEADFHEDFVQPKPNLYLDGHPVILNGEWKI